VVSRIPGIHRFREVPRPVDGGAEGWVDGRASTAAVSSGRGLLWRVSEGVTPWLRSAVIAARRPGLRERPSPTGPPGKDDHRTRTGGAPPRPDAMQQHLAPAGRRTP
jgi:hypothetical protein